MLLLGALIGVSLGAAVAALPAGAASPADSTTAGTGAHYFRMKQVQIIDQGGFEKPMPAVSMMVPTNWKFQGQVTYSKDFACLADMAQVTYRAENADRSVVLEGFPAITWWRYADDPNVQRMMVQENQSNAKYGRKPCAVAKPALAADLLRNAILPGFRQGKTIASIEPLPEFAEAMRLRLGLPKEGTAATGMSKQPEPRIDAARARLQYDLNGQAVEEWAAAVTVIWAVPAGPGRPGQGQAYTYDCHGVMVMALGAPAGRLDARDKLFKLIASTVRRDPQWGAQLDQIIAKTQQHVQQNQQQQQAMINQFQQRVIQANQEVAANRMAASHSSLVANDQLIRGVQTYRNPDTGATIELNNQYGHAWLNGNNEYIMSDDPNFNPNASLNGNWTALQPVKPQ